MKSWLVVTSVTLLIAASILAGCNLPERIPVVACGPESLIQPNLESPVWEVVESINPALAWSYASTCPVEEFVVEISTSMGFPAGSVLMETIPEGGPLIWNVTPALDEAAEYFWRVTPYMSGVQGPPSEIGRFFTGPSCAREGLPVPHLLSPLDGATVDNPHQPFVWEYPDGCTPDHYIAELVPASAAGFSTAVVNLFDEPSYPAAAQIPRDPMEDCTAYIWRVTASDGAGEGAHSGTFHLRTNFDDTCPDCLADSFTTPVVVYPQFNTIVESFTPTMIWDYSGFCWPENFVVEVAPYNDFSVGLISGDALGSAFSWTIPSALQPASHYVWRVAPRNGSATGEYSLTTPFWTGPVCATADLVAPVLVEPANTIQVGTLTPYLAWDYPDETCLPQNYTIQISEQLDFTTTFLDWPLPLHSTRILLTDDAPLSDCTIYFWRVWGRNDDGDGPPSEVFNFYTNASGGCPPLAGPAPAPEPEKKTCPLGEVLNEETEKCELIDCRSVTNEETCNSYPQCTWDIYKRYCYNK